ncbi:hypothetical protein K501DRAFT_277845 [Backusella circina FSU 941]|nr:hypothetical protein K501DRAFT_277845 [Backusella circina FSU 941]
MPPQRVIRAINYWLHTISELLIFLIPFVYDPIIIDYQIEEPKPHWLYDPILTDIPGPLITLPARPLPKSPLTMDFCRPISAPLPIPFPTPPSAPAPICGTSLYLIKVYKAIIDTDVLFPDGFVFPWYIFGLDENFRGTLNELDPGITACLIGLLWTSYHHITKRQSKPTPTPTISPVRSLFRLPSRSFVFTDSSSLTRADNLESIPQVHLLKSQTYHDLQSGIMKTMLPTPESLRRGKQFLEYDIQVAMKDEIPGRSGPPIWPIPPTDHSFVSPMPFVRSNHRKLWSPEEYDSENSTPTKENTPSASFDGSKLANTNLVSFKNIDQGTSEYTRRSARVQGPSTPLKIRKSFQFLSKRAQEKSSMQPQRTSTLSDEIKPIQFGYLSAKETSIPEQSTSKPSQEPIQKQSKVEILNENEPVQEYYASISYNSGEWIQGNSSCTEDCKEELAEEQGTDTPSKEDESIPERVTLVYPDNKELTKDTSSPFEKKDEPNQKQHTTTTFTEKNRSQSAFFSFEFGNQCASRPMRRVKSAGDQRISIAIRENKQSQEQGVSLSPDDKESVQGTSSPTKEEKIVLKRDIPLSAGEEEPAEEQATLAIFPEKEKIIQEQDTSLVTGEEKIPTQEQSTSVTFDDNLLLQEQVTSTVPEEREPDSHLIPSIVTPPVLTSRPPKTAAMKRDNNL